MNCTGWEIEYEEKTKKMFIVILCIILVPQLFKVWYIYRTYKVETGLEYCKEIAGEINHIGLSQYFCGNIHARGDIVFKFFSFQTRFHISPLYKEYSYDEGTEDMIKVKNYLTDYLEQHPENELNEKEIMLWFIWKPDVDYGDTKIYNYNFGASDNGIEYEFTDAKDFFYIEDLRTDHMSVLEGFENVRVISVSINDVDSYECLKGWNNLQYIYVHGGGNKTEEEKQKMRKIREFVPAGCKVKFTSID